MSTAQDAVDAQPFVVFGDGVVTLRCLRASDALGMILKDQRLEPVPARPSSAVAATAPVPTVTEQAFSRVSDFSKDRKAGPVVESTTASVPDVADQLVKLASLRDAGVLTEEEFAAKKTELLSRL